MLLVIGQYNSYSIAVKLLKKLFMIYSICIFILHKYQFGSNHSTIHALTEITEQIRNACDKSLYTYDVYLEKDIMVLKVSLSIGLSHLYVIGFNTLQ